MLVKIIRVKDEVLSRKVTERKMTHVEAGAGLVNGELLVDRGSIHGGEQPSREKMRDLYEPFIPETQTAK